MLIACAMCGGIVESSAVVALAAASMIGAELYNRGRAAVHNRRQTAARVARIIGAEQPQARATRRIVAQAANLRRDRRELAAEYAAS